jgi:predicted DNA-binding antitoxin AbrB/MazE fold protein
MIAVNGIYENGVVKLDRKMQALKTTKVIVTFLDDELPDGTKRLIAKDFSFKKAREITSKFNGSLSDAVIEDRTEEI